MRAPLLALLVGCLAPSVALAQASAPDDDPEPADSTEDAAEPEAAPPARTPPPPRAQAEDPPPQRSGATTASPPPRSEGTAGAPGLPQPAGRAPAEEEEEEEDGGDPYDFLWIDIAGGFSYVNMRALDATNYYPDIVVLSGTGPMGSVAAGFRIEFLAVGVRGTLAHYSDGFDVGTATAEATLMLPIPVVKPYLRVGFGLGWHGDSNYMAPANSQTTVFGFAFNGAVGLDVYLVEWFSIGAAFSADILNMSRQRIDDPSTAGTIDFSETGDAVGIQIRGQVGVTFHL
ncbi:MAG: hypothetical protein H6719_09355 [Sandaracinaceae bacterium]|nr:hypothetical protein [Sandaracinaceae bacterium]